MKTLLMVLFLCMPFLCHAQLINFHVETLRTTTDANGDGTASNDPDTLFYASDSISTEFPGMSAMTIYYIEDDVTVAGTVLYFQSKIHDRRSGVTIWVTTDSLTVAATGTTWGIWNITDAAIGVTPAARIVKSSNADSLRLKYAGVEEVRR